MPWTSATFARDTDSAAIMTVTTVFADADATTLTYASRVVTSSLPSKTAYRTAANAAVAAWQAKKTSDATLQTQIVSFMNS